IRAFTGLLLKHITSLLRNLGPRDGRSLFVALVGIFYIAVRSTTVPWRISVDAPNDLPVSRPRVFDEIRATMARIGLDPAGVDPETHLVDDLDLDSLDWVDLAMRFEETFSIELPEKRFASVRIVQDIVDLVYAALVEANGAPT
ncbi:MAG: acyl carrier protein, partial [Acidobacteriota bacterium]|nr:acyl carrier protein [Acidobacteriota bacterium]